MNDPVIMEDGMTYDRIPIFQFLKKNLNSPVTGEKVFLMKLTPNEELKSTIEDFKKIL
jgi:hypothetical protein